jgi:hypothetical protein
VAKGFHLPGGLGVMLLSITAMAPRLQTVTRPSRTVTGRASAAQRPARWLPTPAHRTSRSPPTPASLGEDPLALSEGLAVIRCGKPAVADTRTVPRATCSVSSKISPGERGSAAATASAKTRRRSAACRTCGARPPCMLHTVAPGVAPRPHCCQPDRRDFAAHRTADHPPQGRPTLTTEGAVSARLPPEFITGIALKASRWIQDKTVLEDF